MKRILDIVVAVALLIILLPIGLMVAVMIKMDSPGPLYFRQKRIGLGGTPFNMMKFRSMVVDASVRGPYYTIQGDSRITHVGKFLRRTSIDELPQLINVIKGEMSLIGPRPDVPEQRALYTDAEWDLRCSLRPGMTGWAQVIARNTCTEKERKELDFEYIRNGGFWLDVKILVMTFRNVYFKRSY